ncbi:hypothetical protein WH50_08170 [Pokkaliibacter plantistimulans]|uniref:ABC transporter permease n=1 Tax=Pokkaliibacter plantistimulans TaxID=1635171 RepID=A0ABX5M214_9GAMM|nr:DUF4198 domain-containing protein [Pokkaliibacter plantistimulans]PXF31713.1 hypothetical protein WH50_08170 [Pokkaliibacter plantistimulans]
MKKTFLVSTLALTMGLVTMQAQAHSRWILPLQPIVSGHESEWVSFDVSASNTLFQADKPARLDGMVAVMPDGSQGVAVEGYTDKRRSVFSYELTQPGTYKFEQTNEGYMVMRERPQGAEQPKAEGGKPQGEGKPGMGPQGPGRGMRADTLEALLAQLPDDGKAKHIVHSLSRVETFVTRGKPTDAALKPTNKGIEMVPLTHPADLFTGEPATFQFLLNGKPAADLAVELTPGGTAYRNERLTQSLKTDGEGKIKVEWPMAGPYLVEVEDEVKLSEGKVNSERYGYFATLVVQPQ